MVQTAYAAGALSLTGAAGTAGAPIVVLIVPASIVVPQELHPVETGAETPQPQLGAAGAAHPYDGARVAHPHDGAGAAQPHDGAGAGQHVGAGAQQDGAPPQRLAFLA